MKNHFKPGQLLRFVHRQFDDEFYHGCYELKRKIVPQNSFWNLVGRTDISRRVSMSADTVMLYVKHCPGIHANLDRAPMSNIIEHDCIATGRGHAIVIVNETMFQVPYSSVRRIK